MAAGKLTSRFGDGNSSVGGSWDRGPFGGGYFRFLSWSPFLLLPSTPQHHSWSIPGCLCETKTTPPTEESARLNRPGDVWVVPVDQGASQKENRWKGLIIWGSLPYVVQFSVTSIFFKINIQLHSLTKWTSCTFSFEHACNQIFAPGAWEVYVDQGKGKD